MTLYESLKRLQSLPGHYAQRISAELVFAESFNRCFECGWETALQKQASALLRLEAIGPQAVEETEQALAPLGKRIKELTVLAVAHAHIDMNWMWRYDETVEITLSTFRTILKLMEEYPKFTFSQSQASVYRIAEQYDPELLDEIRQRVAEGRWEPTVSTWVEPDKNMPSGETLCRHILYAKQYMGRLFGLRPDDLQLDFEPDTFGHNKNVPVILSNGGVKYYYHCRGYEGHNIYRWRSGKHEVLAYREPVWYNSEITCDDFFYMPQFARENGITTLLKVYGVGDHGGGPTRRDLNRLTDMMSWPLLPNIRFGSYQEFYRYLESRREQFPVVEGELNAFATGCFTTQTRIKRFNKLCERQLYEAELYQTLRHMQGVRARTGPALPQAWENVLFNNFHDILPGSGVIDTKEHAMGRYQECLAATGACKAMELRRLAALIDTARYDFAVDDASVSEGGGGGFTCGQGLCSGTERNNTGGNRIYHLFNSTAVLYSTPSVITVWDYPGDLADVALTVQDVSVEYQLLDSTPIFYWGHRYQRIAVDVRVPAFGYTTVVLRPETAGRLAFPYPREPRLDYDDRFVLENERLRVELDPQDCSIRLMTDKLTGKHLIAQKSGYFRLITEDASKEMTAWRIGRYNAVEALTSHVIVRPCDYIQGALVQSLTYEIPFRASRLRVTVSLERGSSMLKYSCTCDFREQAVPHDCVPQLSVFIPCAVQGGSYTADIPFGHITREYKQLDMPCLNGVLVKTRGGGLFAVSNSKYGFRVTEEGISISLVRNSYEPDPLPDFGPCEFDFAIGSAQTDAEMDDATLCYAHPCSEVSAPPSAGSLPEQGSLLKFSGARLSAVKLSEDGRAYIFRLYACGGDVRVVLPFRVGSAALCDLQERPLSALPSEGDTVYFTSTESLLTVRIEKE